MCNTVLSLQICKNNWVVVLKYQQKLKRGATFYVTLNINNRFVCMYIFMKYSKLKSNENDCSSLSGRRPTNAAQPFSLLSRSQPTTRGFTINNSNRFLHGLSFFPVSTNFKHGVSTYGLHAASQRLYLIHYLSDSLYAENLPCKMATWFKVKYGLGQPASHNNILNVLIWC